MGIDYTNSEFSQATTIQQTRQPNSTVQRADVDVQDAELALGINETYKRTRRRALPVADLPATGNEFETITIDNGLEIILYQWRTDLVPAAPSWAVVSTFTKATNTTVQGPAAGGLGSNVANNAILADMAGATLKGRVAGPAGDPQDLTGSQVRAIVSTDRIFPDLATFQADTTDLGAGMTAGEAITIAGLPYTVLQAGDTLSTYSNAGATTPVRIAEAGPVFTNVAALQAARPDGPTVQTVQHTANGGGGYYIQAAGPASATVIATQNGKFYELVGNPTPPQIGAAGNNVADDVAIIAAMNVYDREIDLDGKTYFVNAPFFPVATFNNGQIRATNGTFDYRNRHIAGTQSKSVGAGLDFETPQDFFAWIRSGIRVSGILNLNFGPGTHTINLPEFLAHVDHERILWNGDTMPGAQPTIDDMTAGTQAGNEAIIEARYSTIIDVGGTGDTNDRGLDVCFGWTAENILFKGNTRYGFGAGFNRSLSQAADGGKVVWRNCTFLGSVWGFLASRTNIAIPAATTTLFAYNNVGTQPGGGLDLINESRMLVEGNLHIYNGDGAQPAKFGINVETGSSVTRSGLGEIRIVGHYAFGVRTLMGCRAEVDGLITDGVTSPLSADPYSHIKCTGGQFSNGALVNTNMLVVNQVGFGNNINTGASLVPLWAGNGASLNLFNCTLTNMNANYMLVGFGGSVRHIGLLQVDGTRSGIATVRLYNSHGNFVGVNSTNPAPGDLAQALAQGGSHLRLEAASNIGTAPLLNTTAGLNAAYNNG